MSSNTKRWLVLAGVMSCTSDTDSAACGGRPLDPLSTGVFCGYAPAWPPVQPVNAWSTTNPYR